MVHMGHVKTRAASALECDEVIVSITPCLPLRDEALPWWGQRLRTLLGLSNAGMKNVVGLVARLRGDVGLVAGRHVPWKKSREVLVGAWRCGGREPRSFGVVMLEAAAGMVVVF